MFFFLGLGSNVGDRLTTLTEVTTRFAICGQLLKQSAVYETLPVGGPKQSNYLNAALFVQSAAAPWEFLQQLLRIEAEFGRVRHPSERNFPRPLDIDILLMGKDGSQIIQSPRLSVPHPRLHLRTFVLKPLLDLDPALVHPTLEISVSQLYENLREKEPEPVQVAAQLISFPDSRCALERKY